MVRRDVLLVGAQQGAADSRDRARDGECPDLVDADAHADDLRRHVTVADGLQRAAGPRPDEVLGEQRDDGDDTPDQPEVALVAREVLPAERQVGEVHGTELRRRVDADAVVAAGQVGHVAEDVIAEVDQAERDDREVVAAQPQRKRPDGGADDAPDQAGAGKPQGQREVPAAAEPGGGVGAGADEERVAERDLPGVAGQEVQAECADRGDTGVVEDAQPVVVGQQVREQRPQPDERAQPQLRRPGAEQPQVIAVAARQVAVRAVRAPAHTRRTSFVPSSPYGRTSRIAIITTYGMTAEKLLPAHGNRSSW